MCKKYLLFLKMASAFSGTGHGVLYGLEYMVLKLKILSLWANGLNTQIKSEAKNGKKGGRDVRKQGRQGSGREKLL